MDKCDMCGSNIIHGRCDCGEWKSADEMGNHGMHKGIEEFHNMKRFTVTGDAPALGCAVVYFRGDYNDAKKVEKFIFEMKGRKYYEN